MNKDYERIEFLYNQLGDAIHKYSLDQEKNNSKINNEIKAFKFFANASSFLDYTDDLYNVKNWKIYNTSYEERAKILSNYDYWDKIKNEFNSKKLLNKGISDSQLVSFFDTLYLMTAVVKAIKEHKLLEEMSIIMEYVIPGTSKERIDYIVCFRNQLLLIEFSKACSFNELKNVEDKKMSQVCKYKERLSKYLDNSINITPLTCIYLAEENDDNIKINVNNCVEIVNSITMLFNKACKNSLEELIEISKI